MSKISRTSVSFVFMLIMGFTLCLPAKAWWPIAHYEITKHSDYPGIAPYAQLPDYVDSKTLLWWTADGIADVNLYFCWGHAVQDAGKTYACPLKPEYPKDGRYPGPIMWDLIQNKLHDLSAQEKNEMEKTARGFIAHNAADRIVHFDFFGGAIPGDNPLEGKARWELEHRDKERWADYWVYIYVHCGGDSSLAFDGDKLILFNDGQGDYTSGVPVATPSDSMAYIMQLGQKVYSKNRRFTEKNLNRYVLKAQSMSQIKDCIDNYINNQFGTAEEMQQVYSKADFDDLQQKADSEGWKIESVVPVPDSSTASKDTLYMKAIANVNTWISKLPPASNP